MEASNATSSFAAARELIAAAAAGTKASTVVDFICQRYMANHKGSLLLPVPVTMFRATQSSATTLLQGHVTRRTLLMTRRWGAALSAIIWLIHIVLIADIFMYECQCFPAVVDVEVLPAYSSIHGTEPEVTFIVADRKLSIRLSVRSYATQGFGTLATMRCLAVCHSRQETTLFGDEWLQTAGFGQSVLNLEIRWISSVGVQA